MTQKQVDKDMIKKMTLQQAKASLFSAITIIRKTVADVPEKKRKLESSYNKEGHMKCVNYLKGFFKHLGGSPWQLIAHPYGEKTWQTPSRQLVSWLDLM